MTQFPKITKFSKKSSRGGRGRPRSGSATGLGIAKAFVVAVVIGGLFGFWWGKSESQKVDGEGVAAAVVGTILQEVKRILPAQEKSVSDAPKSASKKTAKPAKGSFSCKKLRIIDGDTFVCDDTRVRLAGIDSPETKGHCRPGRVCAPGDPIASTENLRKMVQGNEVTCQRTDTDRYGRTVAVCSAGGVDLSCAQVEGGFAIMRYAKISC